MSRRQIQLLRTVLDLPTAPFAEGQVVEFIRRFVARRSALEMNRDRFGNLLIRYRPERRRAQRVGRRPILFAAHMDHPGFIAGRAMGRRLVQADFHGWVGESYFPRERVRFYSGGRWVRGRIVEVIRHRPGGAGERRAAASARSFRDQHPPSGVVVKVAEEVAPGSPGMWDLPDAAIRGHSIHARVCDDLAGLAGVLCMLDAVCRRRSAVPCDAFFTRAEEVGFAGALAAVDAGSVPREALVVAVECSKAVTGVSLGAGPVLRVGDRASVFTPALTAYCQVVAERLAAADKTFRFQRKLMDGGTCESTAYCHYGYDATGLCLPLGNYHNMDERRGRIGAEFVDLRDFLGLVKWFVALAESPGEVKYDGRHPGLSRRLEALLRRHRGALLRTAEKQGRTARS